MRKKRALSPQAQDRQETSTAEGDEVAAFVALIEDEEGKALSTDSQEEQVVAPPGPAVLPESPTLDTYLRKQVLLEMYGTDTPSSYERTIQALKDRL